MNRRLLHIISFLLLSCILAGDAVVLFKRMNWEIEVAYESEGKTKETQEENKQAEDSEIKLNKYQPGACKILAVLTLLHSESCKHPEVNDLAPSFPALSVLTQPPERA